MLVCYTTLAVPNPKRRQKSWHTAFLARQSPSGDRELLYRRIDASCTPPQPRNLVFKRAALPSHHAKHMPQTRSQTKADQVDARIDLVAYYLAVAVPLIFLYTVAQNLGYA